MSDLQTPTPIPTGSTAPSRSGPASSTHPATGRVVHAAARWWIYQRERFPLWSHVTLIAAFSFSTISFSVMLRAHAQLPGAKPFFVAFATALLFFLQLRIADEFKDREEDARYRPYRPVPRGLVSLRELGVLGIAGAACQAALALWLSAALLPLLALTWAYLALMTCEFFARSWLKARPFTYMWTHMLILPLVDLYCTACDWRVVGALPQIGLVWLLLASFGNGFVLEIGRKIRAPWDEEPGVQTYTAVWGRRRALGAWLAALTATASGTVIAASQIGFPLPAVLLLGGLLPSAIVLTRRFLHQPDTRKAELIEKLSGLWALLMYLSLGALPVLWQL